MNNKEEIRKIRTAFRIDEINAWIYGFSPYLFLMLLFAYYNDWRTRFLKIVLIILFIICCISLIIKTITDPVKKRMYGLNSKDFGKVIFGK